MIDEGGIEIGQGARGASLTAVIPAYNASRHLADAIGSVRAQTRAVDELIVVDDCSTDDTADVARSQGARVVRQPRNMGPAAARNAGLAAATTELVAFLDADDRWLPDHCALVAGLLDEHPNAVVAAGNSAATAQLDAQGLLPPVDVALDALPWLVLTNFVPQSAAVVRRRMVLAAGGYRTDWRHAEDYDLWLRLSVDHPFARTGQVSFVRREHPDQLSRDGEQMLRNGWTAKLTAASAVAVRDDAARASKVREALRRTTDVNLGEMWYGDTPALFDLVMELTADVPELQAIRRSWRWRRRVGWRAWNALRRAKHAYLS